MRTRLLTSGWVLLLSGLLAASVDAQMRGGRGFGRRGGPTEFTPEQRREMYDRMTEHQLEHFKSDYDLTSEQQEQVRARLNELKTEQWEYIEPLQEEYQKLREEMHESFHLRRDGQEVNEERLDQVRERLREIWSGSPLMNPERSTEAVEKLLPKDQVEKGRQRRAERWAEREQRRESWQERRGDRRDRGRDRDGRDGRFSFGRGDPWDRYVDDFTRRYQLDSAQQATAQSILRELKQERDMYREVHREDFEALQGLDDWRARREAYGKLNEPIDQIYEQLRDRLARIPTSAQIRAEEQSRPASRPAGPASRPSGDRLGRRR